MECELNALWSTSELQNYQGRQEYANRDHFRAGWVPWGWLFQWKLGTSLACGQTGLLVSRNTHPPGRSALAESPGASVLYLLLLRLVRQLGKNQISIHNSDNERSHPWFNLHAISCLIENKDFRYTVSIFSWNTNLSIDIPLLIDMSYNWISM